MCTGNFGGGGRGRRGPIYRENEPPFQRKRLKNNRYRAILKKLIRRSSHRVTQGKKSHPKDHPPKKKQFAQKVCANSFVCFLLILKGKGGQFVQTVPKLFAQTVCANCFYLGEWFFGWLFPS